MDWNGIKVDSYEFEGRRHQLPINEPLLFTGDPLPNPARRSLVV